MKYIIQDILDIGLAPVFLKSKLIKYVFFV